MGCSCSNCSCSRPKPNGSEPPAHNAKRDYEHKRAALVVLAKAPRPRLVKTRLCPPLEPEQAAALYECMLDDVLEAVHRLPGAQAAAVTRNEAGTPGAGG